MPYSFCPLLFFFLDNGSEDLTHIGNGIILLSTVNIVKFVASNIY